MTELAPLADPTARAASVPGAVGRAGRGDCPAGPAVVLVRLLRTPSAEASRDAMLTSSLGLP